uniref:Late embryogenesis abundant protein LEA-2 subgroup domain-containing protein n=1 Tax=Oryza glumipatula TaxID=40148 RepID=A0A0D9YDZ8_9ORYZ
MLVSRVVRLPVRVLRPVTAIHGLDAAPAGASAAGTTIISPAIDVTLNVNNRRGTARCYRGGEAVVSYEGFTVASGTVPGFCVPGKRAREVPFLASADGVGLPQQLRGRMALERRIGAMQLEVEVKLFGRDGGTAPRPTWMSCGLRMDEAQLPKTAHCSVLALQNWFSQPLFG